MNLKIQKTKLNDVLKFIFLIIYIGLICFSFRSSNQNSTESSNLSEEVTEDVIETIQIVDKDFNPDFDTFHAFIRKAVGHFGVFLITGIFGLLTFLYFRLKVKWSLIVSLSSGIIVAIMAELIQLFSSGRSCEVKDMAIDYSGYIIGSLLTLLIVIIVLKKKNIRNLD